MGQDAENHFVEKLLCQPQSLTELRPRLPPSRRFLLVGMGLQTHANFRPVSFS
jgi:hypothetical protein